MAVEVLCRAVYNYVGAEIERTLYVRSAERIVNNDLYVAIVRVGDFCNLFYIDELEIGICWRLKIDYLCVRTDVGFHKLYVAEVDERDFDAVAGESVCKERECASVKRIIGKKVITGFESGPHDRCYCTHTGTHHETCLRIFEYGKLLRDLVGVRVSQTRINIARLFAAEAARALLRVVEHECGRLENGHCQRIDSGNIYVRRVYLLCCKALVHVA